MARVFSYLLSIGKRCIAWSWTYLWLLWLLLVIFLIYVLRGPLKINENLSMGKCEHIWDVARISREKRRFWFSFDFSELFEIDTHAEDLLFMKEHAREFKLILTC